MSEEKTMQIGCCVPIDKYELLRQSGFDYAEFPASQVEALTDEELDELISRIQKGRVPCIRLNAYCEEMPAITGEGCDDEKTCAYARSLMSKASKLGVRFIGVGAPLARALPEGYDRTLADGQCERFLRLSGEIAGEYGITILLEALNSEACNYINRLSEALDMVKRVDMDSVGMMADLYHMEKQGESWDILPEYAPYIRHMHLSTDLGAKGRGLFAEKDQSYCDKAFEAIKKSGYHGTVSIEPAALELSLSSMETAQNVMRRSARR